MIDKHAVICHHFWVGKITFLLVFWVGKITFLPIFWVGFLSVLKKRLSLLLIFR